MNYGTVCSGVEAFGPAWKTLGLTPAFHAEIATHPAAVLRYHYPTVPNYGDFTTIEYDPAQPIQLLAGGTPCQDFSVAGLRRGLAGKRGNLTLEFAGLAQRLRPRWLVWENVPGVLSADGGRAFGQFLTVLAECGYYAAYRVLDAQHFGVPQRRRRVFLVAYLGDWRPAAAVLFERESLRWDSAPRYKSGQAIAAALTTSPYADNESQHSRLVAFGGNNTSGPIDTATTLMAHPSASGRMDFASETFLCVTGDRTHTLTAEGHDASEDGTGRGTPIIAQCHGGSVGPLGVLKATASVQSGVPFTTGFHTDLRRTTLAEEGQAFPTLTKDAQRGGNVGGVFGWNKSASQTMRIDAATTDAVQAAPSSQPALFNEAGVRRLTPLECERLMGYPDDWTRYGVKPNGTRYEVADGPRYQMCGNGWATPVATWVAERVMMVERLLNPA